MNWRIAFLVSSALAIASRGGAQAPPPQLAAPSPAAIDALFTWWDRRDSPGCALAVVRDGRVVYSRGYGMADLEHDVPITPASVFQIASVSKQFTAMSAELLRKGRLNSGKEINYAGGLSHGTHRGLTTLSHNGVHAGYRTTFVRFPEQRLSVILLANLSSITPAPLARKVADLYLAPVIQEEAANAPSAKPAEKRKLDAALLDAYAGQYRFRPGLTRTFVKEGDRLLMLNGGSRLPMVAVSDQELYAEGFTARYRFSAPEAGKSREVVRRDDGEEMTGRRLEPFTPAPSDLQACAGRYYSPELEVIYTLDVREGKLTATHRRGEVSLRPVTRDEWDSRLATFTFSRGRGGKVEGFVLNTSRSRNVRFQRVELRLRPAAAVR